MGKGLHTLRLRVCSAAARRRQHREKRPDASRPRHGPLHVGIVPGHLAQGGGRLYLSFDVEAVEEAEERRDAPGDRDLTLEGRIPAR